MDIEKTERQKALLREMVGFYRQLATALAAGEWQAVQEIQPRLEGIKDELALLSSGFGPAGSRGAAGPAEPGMEGETETLAREAVDLCEKARSQAQAARDTVGQRLVGLGHNRQSLAKYRPSRWYSPQARFTSYCA